MFKLDNDFNSYVSTVELTEQQNNYAIISIVFTQVCIYSFKCRIY